MRRFAAAILITIVSAGAAETNAPVKLSETQQILAKAEALLAELDKKEPTNAPVVAEQKTATNTAHVEPVTDITNLNAPKTTALTEEELKNRLEFVRTLRFQKSFEMAEKQVKDLLSEKGSAEVKRLALLEYAYIAQDAQQPIKAQQVFSEYLRRNPKDPSVPEICLRQGLLYRQMGAHQQALTKFYQVMNHALSLKLDRFEYYQNLVLQAQTEIAETYYLQAKYSEAAEYFTRLLKLEATGLDRAVCHFKLIRSLAAQGAQEKVIAQGQSFTELYPENSDVAEVRFLVADCLRKVGRNRESMQQVLLLLQGQQRQAEKHPELWAYWQQRTGNEIANELYKEGDYMSALEIYSALAKINTAASWQAPVWYQIGLVYEHLKQPAKALEMYDQILSRQAEVRTGTPSQALLAVMDMAQWRRNYLTWGERADKSLEQLKLPPPSAQKETNPAGKEVRAELASGENRS